MSCVRRDGPGKGTIRLATTGAPSATSEINPEGADAEMPRSDPAALSA